MNKAWIIFTTTLAMSACTSCGTDAKSSEDTESASQVETDGLDSGTIDADSDTQSETLDSDSESTSDNDDTETSTELVSTEPWEWEDLPKGEDCGEVCRQVSFSERVRLEQWDVKDGMLVYNGTGAETKMGPQEHFLGVVDVAAGKHLTMPDPHPEDSEEYFTGFPTVTQNDVYYMYGRYSDLSKVELIQATLDKKKQSIIYRYDEPDPESGTLRWSELDASPAGLVSQGGCGDPGWDELCFFPISEPGNPRALVEKNYGSHNTILDNKILYYTGTFDIHYYDLETEQVVKITDDSYIPSQLMARMHGNKVVYQDLRHGVGDGMGNWNHSAVFVYDLETKKAEQIAGGDWIACNPDVYGDVVVWLDFRDAPLPNDKASATGIEIWGKNLKTGKAKQITHFPERNKILPRIWGDKVFVSMFREDSNYDGIFMFDLPKELKTAKK